MKIKLSPMDILIEILSMFLLIGTTVYLAAVWTSVPEKIPMHYNFAGEIDRWGGKGELLFLLAMTWGLFVLVSVIERFPQIWNTGVKVTPENKGRVYRILKYMLKTMKLCIMLIFSFLIIHTIRMEALPGWFMPAILLLMFGNMGFWLIKLYRTARCMAGNGI